MRYIKGLIIFVFIVALFLSNFVAFVFAAERTVYVLNLKYKDGIITRENIMVTKGIFSDITDQPEKGYRAEIISFENKILYAQRFAFSLVVNPIAPPEIFNEKSEQIAIPKEQALVLTETSIELVLPYFTNGKQINIYDPNNKKVLEIPVLQFAETCGDKICEPQENYDSCPADCPLKTAQPNSLFKTAVIAITSPLSAILLIGIIYWIIKRRRRKTSLG